MGRRCLVSLNAMRKVTAMALDAPLEEVWSFFSHPTNLEGLTPPDQRLQVSVPENRRVRSGDRVDIRVSPLPGIRLRWKSLITEVEPPDTDAQGMGWFVDVQEGGPFSKWEHRHAFRALPGGGTAVLDVVEFEVPLGGLGRMVAGRWVRRNIDALFTFRTGALTARFGRLDGGSELLKGWPSFWGLEP